VTAIGINPPASTARSINGSHLVVTAVLSFFIMSGLVAQNIQQATKIEIQSRIAALQSETISTQRSTMGLKFASGFLASCGNPCVIRENPGGVVKDFEWLASLVNVRGQIIVIDGICASACALFADQARRYIRITDRAEFLFHKTSDGSDPPHSPDIAAWVNANGGFPSQESGTLTNMDFDVARRFWQPVFDWQRLPFDLDAPSRLEGPAPWTIAGLRGMIQ